MDVLFFLTHSSLDDIEIRCSLRSVCKHLPWVNKVWIFGDRPEFLIDDTALIEHVPHEYTVRTSSCRVPLRNNFLMLFFSSLIPELSPEYLWFCDDFIVLRDLSKAEARQDRYLGNLDEVKGRGTGMWKESLWRTYGLLKRFGYTALNFESHVPLYMTKKRVLEAYCEFKDYVTEDRFYGLLGPTAILNHAYKTEQMALEDIGVSGIRAGFWHKPASYDEVAAACEGKTFLNFDDEAFGDGIRRFLQECFPEPSRYEKRPDATKASPKVVVGSQIVVP